MTEYKEELEVFNLDGELIGVQDRKEFYDQARKEYDETGKVSKKVKTIRILILSSDGRVYLQKRSKLKPENAGLYDKTIGGHISKSESVAVTVARECGEELGFPTMIFSEEEFDSAIKHVDLEILGVLRWIEIDKNYMSERATATGKFVQPLISYFYIGYYDGAIRFKDGEFSGIETFSLKELEQEIQDNPDKFTADLRDMVGRFKDYLKQAR